MGGTVLGSEALQPPHTATSYRSGVTAPGPFVSSAEMFCGYYLSEAADGAAAVEIAALCPVRFGGVEVRPIMEFAYPWPSLPGQLRGDRQVGCRSPAEDCR